MSRKPLDPEIVAEYIRPRPDIRYKLRLLDIPLREIAIECGMAPSSLTNKLNGYTRFFPEELSKLSHYIKTHKRRMPS